MKIPFNPKHIVNIYYKNWKGETSWRRIVPINIDFKSTKYHTKQQWILEAFDVDKQSHRSFAMCDIITWQVAPKEDLKKAQ